MEHIWKSNANENDEIVTNIFLGLSGFVLIIWILAQVNVFEVDSDIIGSFIIIMEILLVIPTLLIRLAKIRNPMTKYIIIVDTGLMVGVSYLFFTHQMVIMFMIPVLIALLYLDRKMLWFSEGISLVSLVVTHLISVKFVAMPWIEMFTKTEDIVRFNLLPRLLQLMACYFIINMLLDKVNEYFQQYDRVIGENHGSLEKKDSGFDEFIEILDQLTESEKNVFLELLHGKTNSQIAEELSLSGGTVKNYVSCIYDKIECRERSYIILKYSAEIKKYDQGHIKK